MKVNQLEDAKTHFIRATEFSTNAHPYVALANLYVVQDRVMDAVAVYTKALELVQIYFLNFPSSLYKIIHFPKSYCTYLVH